MAESLYNIVFRGELVGGADPAVVKENLAKVFKMDAGRVEKLFSGKAVVLKKNADKATAMKFRAVMKKAGAQCEMRPLEDAAQDTAAGGEQSQRASFAAREPQTAPLSGESEKAADASAASASSASSEGAAEPAPTAAGEPPVDQPAATPPDSELVGTIRMGGTGFSGEFEVAPTGTELGEDSDRGEAAAPDISHLSLAPPGADLEELHPDRKVEVPDISHLKVVNPDEAEKENQGS